MENRALKDFPLESLNYSFQLSRPEGQLMNAKGGVGDLKMVESFSKGHSWKWCRKSLYS